MGASVDGGLWWLSYNVSDDAPLFAIVYSDFEIGLA